MTFNIRYGTARDGEDSWSSRGRLVMALLRRQAPDVIGLQEALRFQLDEIGGSLPGYAEVGVGRDDGRTRGEYAAILYRADRFQATASGTFWFSDTPEVPGSMSWGNRITRICTWARLVERASGRAFYVFNVHLDHESAPSRERSATLLVERIARRSSPDPVVVTGDFNAGESDAPVRHLAERGFIETFRARHPVAQDVGTFHGFRGGTTGAKIDFVFASPAWMVRAAAIDRTHQRNRYPSDHYPVTARLVLPSRSR